MKLMNVLYVFYSMDYSMVGGIIGFNFLFVFVFKWYLVMVFILISRVRSDSMLFLRLGF